MPPSTPYSKNKPHDPNHKSQSDIPKSQYLKDKLSNSPTPTDKAKTAGANINKIIKTKVKLINYSSNIKEKERESYKEKERESFH